MSTQKRKYDIFLSYRRDGGGETAKHLRDTLTERGYSVFFGCGVAARRCV